MGIKVDNLTEPGECKAALIKYYRGLNTAGSEFEATKALRQEVEATKAAPAYQIRVKVAAEVPAAQAKAAAQKKAQAAEAAATADREKAEAAAASHNTAKSKVGAAKAALADQIRAKEVVVTPSTSAVSSSHALRAKGALLKNAPSPHKAAGLNWKATSTTGLGLMAGGLRSLMGLIGKAWPDRLAMFHCITDLTVAACDDAADLGVADRDLGDLPQKLINNTAD